MRSASTARALRRAAGAVTVAGLAWALAAAPVAAADRAEPGPDLAFGQTAPIDGVEPGSTTGVAFTVKNKGDAPASGLSLFIDGSQGLSFAKEYSNCIYDKTPAQDEGPAQVNAVCDIEQTLEPGVVYVPEEPVGVTLLDRALYEHLSLTIQEDSLTFPGGTQHGGGADPVLRLVAQEPPADPGAVYGQQQQYVFITAENTADFALTGAKVKGKAGDTVNAEVTFANKGPAWVKNDVGSPIGVFDVGIPQGTKVTKAPEFCVPSGSSAYRCTTPYNYVDENSERAYVFGLRIDKVVANATGKVAFVKGNHRWGTLPFDKNPKNNAASLVVNASTGGTGEEAQSAGGSSGGATPGSGTPSGGAQDDELADTGSAGTVLVGGAVAAALLVAGGFALTARRRTGRS
ncbi:hypothetical protein ACFWNG_21990 [Streptomyces sp. NPDC058391]|uniref:hypothetical protein n=1 Tax=Streptomyces sp. NPDC058391 TaxID=3346476 RepID=UPI003659802D